MKGGAYAMFCFGLLFFLCVLASRQAPHALPSRPIDQLTNWGQGRAPDTCHCPPGTIRIDTEDGLFLECLRGTN